MLVSGADDLKKSNPSLYLQMLSVKVDATSVTTEQINTDLHRYEEYFRPFVVFFSIHFI